MSRVWSGLRSGLKFNCTACGKCCQNKRSNVSLNLSEVESMSAHLAIDKLTFLEKYTEEKVVDGQVLTKLAHKKDLTCVLLDVENVIGEAEWKTESRKCEGIIIDKYFPSLGPGTNLESIQNENEDEKNMKAFQNSFENNMKQENENSALEKILYDGVIPEYENTFHGSLNAYWRKKNPDGNTMESVVFSADNLVESANIVVLPDTIMRQMIIHEIHSEGLGPDWGYQDSVEYLLESESNSMETDSGNVLEDFKTEFCDTHFSKIIYEDKSNLLRVVDTTTPRSKIQELVLNLSGDCDSGLSEEKYENYLLDFEEGFIMKNHYINPNNQDDNNSENENDDNEDDEIKEIKILETKRRFEFINSDNLAQTEILFSTPDTPGLGGQNEKNGNVNNASVKSVQFDHSRLMMPVHQVLSVIGQRILNDYKHDENNNYGNNNDNNSNNSNNNNNNNNENQETLWAVIGAGGFALPSHFTSLIPHYKLLNTIRIDAIEPESKVLDLAQKYFDAHFVTAQITENGKETNMSGRDRKHTEGDSLVSTRANVHAYETDGLSYLQNNKNKIDFLLIDAFEETPIGGFKSDILDNNASGNDGKGDDNTSNKSELEVKLIEIDVASDGGLSEGGFSEGYFSNRAPPFDMISDVGLLVRNLRGKNGVDGKNSSGGMDGIDGLEVDGCSGGMCGSGGEKKDVNVGGDILLENMFDKNRGGILAINIYGPTEWLNQVFNIINDSSDLSPPVMIRIKGQKNVLLLSSRISGETK